MAFRPTDLPLPVAPATSRCGILVKSATNTSLLTVQPRHIGSLARLSWKAFDPSTSRMGTTCGSRLGTSMPMVPLPGMGAMMRMPRAARLSAMSSSRPRILLTRTPSCGTISNSVTVGPTCTMISLISIPYLLKVSRMRSLFSSCSCLSTLLGFMRMSCSRSRVGKR